LNFELLEDEINKTEQIKNLVMIDLVHYQDNEINLSACLSEDLGQGYSTLSKPCFRKGRITIEHYFIAKD
jgi:hypothetical protein